MRDFMPHHTRQFRLFIRVQDEPAVDVEESAAERFGQPAAESMAVDRKIVVADSEGKPLPASLPAKVPEALPSTASQKIY